MIKCERVPAAITKLCRRKHCDSDMPLEMDALDAAITSLVDTAGPVTNDALAGLLRGLASTLTTTFNELIAKKDDQISALQARLTVVEEHFDDLEQYSRRNTVRIRGIAESANEDTGGLVKDLAARKLPQTRQQTHRYMDEGRGDIHKICGQQNQLYHHSTGMERV